MDEFELIERFFVREGEESGVIAGIGDDGAILRPDPGFDLVTVVDTLVEGVHFPAAIDAADIGYRAVAVNLSDIAAMGATPRWMTLALTLTAADERWVGRFADGLFDAASKHGVTLVGGDITHGDAVVTSVQIIGLVEQGRAIRRSGARPGDVIYVTGTVGDAAAGLQLIAAGKPDDALSQRFLRPEPRVSHGHRIARKATAAIDISDGLYADLGKLLDASGVGGEIYLDALPISGALAAAFGEDEQRRFALSGGDDYELCYTSPKETRPVAGDVPVTAIGMVTDGGGLVCRADGRIVEYTDSGYRHFV